MIAAWRGTSMLSRAIEWQTRSPYSHIGWVRPDWTTFEAWHRGGVRLNASPWALHVPGTPVELYRIAGLTAEQLKTIEQFLRAQVGTNYDFRSILRFISRRSASIDGRWFCSELVFAACQAAGIDLLRATEPWEVSPGLLMRSPLLEWIGTFTHATDTLHLQTGRSGLLENTQQDRASATKGQ